MKSPVGRWKSKEKQSRLISTAPVHQPSAPSSAAQTPPISKQSSSEQDTNNGECGGRNNTSTSGQLFEEPVNSEEDTIVEQLRAAELTFNQDKLM